LSSSAVLLPAAHRQCEREAKVSECVDENISKVTWDWERACEEAEGAHGGGGSATAGGGFEGGPREMGGMGEVGRTGGVRGVAGWHRGGGRRGRRVERWGRGGDGDGDAGEIIRGRVGRRAGSGGGRDIWAGVW
jgi:hypothetical protein